MKKITTLMAGNSVVGEILVINKGGRLSLVSRDWRNGEVFTVDSRSERIMARLRREEIRDFRRRYGHLTVA